MKKHWKFLLVIFFISSPSLFFQCQNRNVKVSDIDKESAKERILETFKTFESFMESENLELFQNVFSKTDLLVIATDGPRFIGYDSFKSAVEDMFAAYDDGETEIGEPQDVVIDLQSTGDLAWFTYNFVWKGSINGQSFTVDQVRFSGIAVKLGENWLIEKLHASVAVPE